MLVCQFSCIGLCSRKVDRTVQYLPIVNCCLYMYNYSNSSFLSLLLKFSSLKSRDYIILEFCVSEHQGTLQHVLYPSQINIKMTPLRFLWDLLNLGNFPSPSVIILPYLKNGLFLCKYLSFTPAFIWGSTVPSFLFQVCKVPCAQCRNVLLNPRIAQ